MIIFKLGAYAVSLEEDMFYILKDTMLIKECNSIREAIFFINNETKHLL